MIGISLKITPIDEPAYEVRITPRSAVGFERHFNMSLTRALAEEQRQEHVYYLAWEASRNTGHKVKLFDGWLDTIEKVEFVIENDDPKDEAD